MSVAAASATASSAAWALVLTAGWICILLALRLVLDGLGIDVEVWYGILLGAVGCLLLRTARIMRKVYLP